MARASRNRTLQVSEAEKPLLRQRLLLPKDISSSNFTDRTIHGNLLDTLQKLPDEFADLVIIDPPYNLSKDFGSMKFDALSHEDYAFYLQSWFPAVCRKLKPHGSLYICGDWRSAGILQAAMEEELHLLNRITWQREKGRGAMRNWKNALEDIWFGVKDKRHYTFNVADVKMKRKVLAPYRKDGLPKDWNETDEGKFRDTYPSNFWDDLCVPFWSMPENTEHPTQKPEKLIAKLILASSNPGDMVFDPLLGSGTTSVVAKKLGRHFCGVEISEDYCFMAEKRLIMAESDKRIQGLADGIFWERNSQPLPNKQDGNNTKEE